MYLQQIDTSLFIKSTSVLYALPNIISITKLDSPIIAEHISLSAERSKNSQLLWGLTAFCLFPNAVWILQNCGFQNCM